MTRQDPELRTALAAEYALGTLHGLARRRFERLLTKDPVLREEVERWQKDLYQLIELLPDRDPSPSVWRVVAQRVAPPPAVVKRAGLWESLVFWRSWGLLAGALAVALAVYVGADLLRPTPPDYAVILSDSAERPAWLARLDRTRDRLSVQALRPQELAADRSFELWLLPGEGDPPRSLGLIPAQGSMSLSLPPELERRLPAAKGLAVSLEPAGGSPTNQPTGPVLYQGALLPPA
jgi:anti-sigma-K factor RskA